MHNKITLTKMSRRKKAEFAETWLLLCNCSVDYRVLAVSVTKIQRGNKEQAHKNHVRLSFEMACSIMQRQKTVKQMKNNFKFFTCIFLPLQDTSPKELLKFLLKERRKETRSSDRWLAHRTRKCCTFQPDHSNNNYDNSGKTRRFTIQSSAEENS